MRLNELLWIGLRTVVLRIQLILIPIQILDTRWKNVSGSIIILIISCFKSNRFILQFLLIFWHSDSGSQNVWYQTDPDPKSTSLNSNICSNLENSSKPIFLVHLTKFLFKNFIMWWKIELELNIPHATCF